MKRVRITDTLLLCFLNPLYPTHQDPTFQEPPLQTNTVRRWRSADGPSWSNWWGDPVLALTSPSLRHASDASSGLVYPRPPPRSPNLQEGDERRGSTGARRDRPPSFPCSHPNHSPSRAPGPRPLPRPDPARRRDRTEQVSPHASVEVHESLAPHALRTAHGDGGADEATVDAVVTRTPARP